MHISNRGAMSATWLVLRILIIHTETLSSNILVNMPRPFLFDREAITVCLHWITALQLRPNRRYGVSNHQPCRCLFNRLFRYRSKKTPISASLAFVRGTHRGPVNSPHTWPVTRKMFPLMISSWCLVWHTISSFYAEVSLSPDPRTVTPHHTVLLINCLA